MRLEVYSPPARDDFQRGLETCFPGWSGRRASSWYFDRAIGAPAADLLSLSEAGTAVAGLAVTYRRLQLARGSEILACFLTAGWTAPAARRRGALLRLLEEGVALATDRGAAVSLAFATEDNTSFRQVRRLGFSYLPTAYLVGDSAPVAEVVDCAPVELDSPAAEPFWSLVESAEPQRTRIVYPSIAAWRSQFLERPHPGELLRIGGDGWAVIESAPGTDRVQFLATPDRPGALVTLLSRARAKRRSLFAFDDSDTDPETWARHGFTVRPGALVVRDLDAAALRSALGDTAPATLRADDLTDPDSAHYLGPWGFQCGDRL